MAKHSGGGGSNDSGGGRGGGGDGGKHAAPTGDGQKPYDHSKTVDPRDKPDKHGR